MCCARNSGCRGPARRLASSPRSRVWRVDLAQGPAVLKQIVAGPGADDAYARETASLRIAARARPPVAPVLLATDPGQRVLVTEHLDHREPAPDWTVGYAAALARLHATTGPEDTGTLPRRQGPEPADAAAFLRLARTLGVPAPVTDSAAGELANLLDRLGRAPGHALLHGDPCPGNDLHTTAGIRFVDFEQACLGSALTELAYLRIGFPTCWCVTSPPEPLLRRAEDAYRTQWRAATGTDVPGLADGGLTDACAGWLLRGDALVQRAPPRRHRPPGPRRAPGLEVGHRDRPPATAPPPADRRRDDRRPSRPGRCERPHHRHAPPHAHPLARTPPGARRTPLGHPLSHPLSHPCRATPPSPLPNQPS